MGSKRETQLFGARIFRQGDAEKGSAVIFIFDVTTSLVSTDESVITAHPVEAGSDINDHIQDNPQMIDLTGAVSNSPVFGTEEIDRDFNALNTLRKIKKDKESLEIVLPGTIYRDMYLYRVTSTRSRRNGQSVRPTLSFKKVNTSQSQITVVPGKKKTKKMKKKNPGENDNGKKDKKPADATQEKQTESFWNYLSGGIAG